MYNLSKTTDIYYPGAVLSINFKYGLLCENVVCAIKMSLKKATSNLLLASLQ
jgi:hypothetical protein